MVAGSSFAHMMMLMTFVLSNQGCQIEALYLSCVSLSLTSVYYFFFYMSLLIFCSGVQYFDLVHFLLHFLCVNLTGSVERTC